MQHFTDAMFAAAGRVAAESVLAVSGVAKERTLTGGGTTVAGSTV